MALYTYTGMPEVFDSFLKMFLFSLFIELLKKEKLVVDSKVYIYAMGMSQAFYKPNELPVLKQWGMKCTDPPQF